MVLNTRLQEYKSSLNKLFVLVWIQESKWNYVPLISQNLYKPNLGLKADIVII